MAKELGLTEVKVYSIDNRTILGSMNEKETKITGIDIRNGRDGVQEDDFAKLMICEMKKELQVTILGKNNTIGCRELNTREDIRYKTVRMQMESAVSEKEAWLIEKTFNDLRGK